MKKKIIFAITLMLMLFSFTGCEKSENTNKKEETAVVNEEKPEYVSGDWAGVTDEMVDAAPTLEEITEEALFKMDLLQFKAFMKKTFETSERFRTYFGIDPGYELTAEKWDSARVVFAYARFHTTKYTGEWTSFTEELPTEEEITEEEEKQVEMLIDEIHESLVLADLSDEDVCILYNDLCKCTAEELKEFLNNHSNEEDVKDIDEDELAIYQQLILAAVEKELYARGLME